VISALIGHYPYRLAGPRRAAPERLNGLRYGALSLPYLYVERPRNREHVAFNRHRYMIARVVLREETDALLSARARAGALYDIDQASGAYRWALKVSFSGRWQVSAAGASRPPRQKPRLGRERGFWFGPPALSAGERGGRPGTSAARERPPSGWRGDERGAFRAGRDGGIVSVRSFVRVLRNPPSSGARRNSGAGRGPSSGGVPPFEGSRTACGRPG